MEAIRTKDGSFTPGLLFATALLILSLMVISRLKDPIYKRDPDFQEGQLELVSEE